MPSIHGVVFEQEQVLWFGMPGKREDQLLDKSPDAMVGGVFPDLEVIGNLQRYQKEISCMCLQIFNQTFVSSLGG